MYLYKIFQDVWADRFIHHQEVSTKGVFI